jgi:hypothetical protein
MDLNARLNAVLFYGEAAVLSVCGAKAQVFLAHRRPE